MFNTFFQNISVEWQSILWLMTFVSAIIHIIFAGAVVRDAERLLKEGIPIQLVSPMVWAFATLVGGVFVAAVYWFMHHLHFVK